MEVFTSVETEKQTSPLVNVELSSIVPYIILYGIPVGHLNNLISYFVAMTSGLGNPRFVIGIWSFLATTGLSSEEDILTNYPNIIIDDAYFDLTTSTYQLHDQHSQGPIHLRQA